MSLITVPVSFIAADQNGNPVAGARITAMLDTTEIYNGLVVPEKIEVLAGANGLAVINLWPNALGVNSSRYRVQAWNPDNGKKFLDVLIAVPNSACNLHEIIVQLPYPAVDASQQALIAAQGALAPVTAQAGIAVAKAAAALASADASQASRLASDASAAAALGSANTATAKADEATARAGEALASRNTATTAAGTATTQAGLSLTSANNSQANRLASDASAAAALVSANNSENSKLASVASAGNASVSASNAQSSANTAGQQAFNASNSADSAAGSAATATVKANSASDSSSLATQKASDAGVSANNASLSASNAATSADTATLKAAEALVSKNDAAVSAGAASTSAGNAASDRAQSVLSAAIATDKAAIATTKASEITASAATANAKAGEAAGSAAQALAIYGTAAAQQTAIATAAAQASLAAGYALSAGSVAQQDLSGVASAALHRSPNGVTAMTVYDTSKDSDGGAWTERCQGTSWYNEPVMGKWLGAQASEFDARYLNAALGSEAVVNGTFNTNLSGWTVGASYSWITGRMYRAPGAGDSANQAIPTVAGRAYRITFSYEVTGSLLRISWGGAVATQVSGAGTSSVIVFATGSSTDLAVAANTTASSYFIDNISVREVTALNTTSGDYFQLSTDGKFYRLWKNLLTYSEDFRNTSAAGGTRLWGHTAVAVDADAVAGPFGGNTADLLKETTLNSQHAISHSITAAVGSVYTASVYVKAAGVQYVMLGVDGGVYTSVTFDIANGTFVRTNAIGGAQYVTGSASVQNLGSGWFRLSAAFIAFQASNNFMLKLNKNNTNTQDPTYTGDGTSGIYLWGTQFELGTTTTTYEAKTTDGTITETFRGNKRSFPKLAGIVAEAGSVTLYDLAEPGRPMWMRFRGDLTSGNSWLNAFTSSPVVSGLAANSGVIAITGSNMGGLAVNFASDDVRPIFSAPRTIYNRSIALRNVASVLALSGGVGFQIANSTINAVAMTVLPDAPTDPVTGLRVPTIAVATGGGVSVIKHNGTVVSPAAGNFNAIKFEGSQLWAAGSNGATWGIRLIKPDFSGQMLEFSNVIYGAGGPTLLGGNSVGMHGATGKLVFGISRDGPTNVVQPILANRVTRNKSLGAIIAPTYNTGHLLGDIRRAYLSDVDVGSVSGAELVVNGDFSVDTTGWSGLQTRTWDSGVLRVSNASGATSDSSAVQTLTGLVIGKIYIVSAVVSAGINGVNFVCSIGASAEGYGGSVAFAFYGFTGVKQSTFVATAASTRIAFTASSLANGGSFTVDNISVREIIADRSYKAQAASITGTLTKTPVSTAAQLVAYSGFSNANYLREPYSADLDFGLGEWNASAWVNVPAVLPTASFPVLPTEVLANWDFSGGTYVNGAYPTFPVSWGLYGAPTSVTVSGGNVLMTTPGSLHGISVAVPTGVLQLVSIRARRVSGASTTRLDYYYGTWLTIVPAGSANGEWFTYTGYINRTNASQILAAIDAGVTDWEIDYVSLKNTAPSLIADRAHASGNKIQLGFEGTGKLTATAFDGTTTRTVTTTAQYNTATWLKAEAEYTTDGTLSILVNGVEVAATRGVPLLSLNSRYNLLTHSQDFDNAAWGKANVTVAANVAAALDGTTTADRLIANNGSNALCYIQQIPSVSGSTSYSIYAKADSASHIGFSTDGGGTSIGVNLSTGAVSLNVFSASVTVAAQANGWYRISTIASPGSSLRVFSSTAAITSHNQTLTGDGTSGVLIWGAQVEAGALKPYQRVGAASDFDFAAPLTIGNSFAADAPFPGSIALLKLSATAPTAEQATWMYEQEKQMFREGAQVTLPDSGAIADLAYDDLTDKWIAVSAANESEWSGLVRTSVTPTPAGSYSKVSAASGVQLLARFTTNPGVDITVPAQNLREELIKRGEAAARLNAQLATYDYVGGFTATTTTGSTAITSVASLTYPVSYVGARVTGAGIQAETFVAAVVGTTVYLTKPATASASAVAISFTDFILPTGMEAKEVSLAGVAQREGATQSWQRLFDGFKETVRFNTAPSNVALIQIQAGKSNA